MLPVLEGISGWYKTTLSIAYAPYARPRPARPPLMRYPKKSRSNTGQVKVPAAMAMTSRCAG